MLSHEEECGQPPKYPCPILRCDRKFKTKKRSEQHAQFEHPQPFDCPNPFCPGIFKTKDEVNDHVARYHAGMPGTTSDNQNARYENCSQRIDNSQPQDYDDIITRDESVIDTDTASEHSQSQELLESEHTGSLREEFSPLDGAGDWESPSSFDWPPSHDADVVLPAFPSSLNSRLKDVTMYERKTTKRLGGGRTETVVETWTFRA
jgi:hypothetical protein